jgi:cytoskeleton-associated protein 5
VYPYVYRILNASSRNAQQAALVHNEDGADSPISSRAASPHGTAGSVASNRQGSIAGSGLPTESPSHAADEPDPDTQLLTIINHISSETTGAQHKEGITELHQFLKTYPQKRARVEKMLESTGAAFRKYINRALASRAAEDQERDIAVADTLSSSFLIFFRS